MQGTPIDRIIVTGFKSIREPQTLRIRPLTIIAGANSAGKSSMMQPMLLLKQSIESPSDPGPIKLVGANAKYSSGEQILTRDTSGPISNEFSVGIEAGGELVTSFYRWESKQGFELTKMAIGAPNAVVFELSSETEILKKAVEAHYMHLFGHKVDEYAKSPFARMTFRLRRERSFFKIVGSFGGDEKDLIGFEYPLARNAVSVLENLIHLPGLRGNPERTYPVSAVGTKYPGLFQDYTASLIVSWQSEGGDEVTGLREDMRKLGLSWKVHATRKDDTQVEIQVGRLPLPKRGGAMDLVNIADVGLGVSQTLPVLVALRAAKKNHLVYIEQPEIHLHPRAQVSLAEIIAAAAKRGVTVVLETHSSIMIRKVQTLVADGDLDNESVSLNWFSRNEEGYTIVENAVPDSAGAYGDWPEDFDDVSLRLESEYLSAVDRRRANQ